MTHQASLQPSMENSSADELVVRPRPADHDRSDLNQVLSCPGPVTEVHWGRRHRGDQTLSLEPSNRQGNTGAAIGEIAGNHPTASVRTLTGELRPGAWREHLGRRALKPRNCRPRRTLELAARRDLQAKDSEAAFRAARRVPESHRLKGCFPHSSAGR